MYLSTVCIQSFRKITLTRKYSVSVFIQHILFLNVMNVGRRGVIGKFPAFQPGGLGSIPGYVLEVFLEYRVWNGVHPASWRQLASYLLKSCCEIRITELKLR